MMGEPDRHWQTTPPMISTALSPETVPLGEGTPTKEELLVYYPAKFTWDQLKTFVNSGYVWGVAYFDVVLKLTLSEILGCSSATRNSSSDTCAGLKASKSSMGVWVIESSLHCYALDDSPANYLRSYRLQWGRVDALSKLPSRLSSPVGDVDYREITLLESGLPPIPPGSKSYFTADIPPQLVSIIMNDWPYSGKRACFVIDSSFVVDRLISPFIHRALRDMGGITHSPSQLTPSHQAASVSRWLVWVHRLLRRLTTSISITASCLPSGPLGLGCHRGVFDT